jgi:hypothetical protein
MPAPLESRLGWFDPDTRRGAPSSSSRYGIDEELDLVQDEWFTSPLKHPMV